METLTIELVKKINLFNQKLYKRENDINNTSSILKTLNSLGCIQLDTLNVVERSHHLFFHSRINNYRQEWLTQLYNGKKVFEGYTKALTLFPIEYYKYMIPFKKRFYSKYIKDNNDINFVLDVYNTIKLNGPSKSRDFKEFGGTTGTWEMSPIRWALNFLWRSGYLEVIRSNNFEKKFDLVENIIPDYILQESHITLEETIEFFIVKALNNMGVATKKEIRNFFNIPKKVTEKEIDRLVNNKKILPVKIQGLNEVHYILVEQFESRYEISQSEFVNRLLLSPFDNLLWDRERLLKLFNFDYRLEAYLPPFQRKYGYYAMPILIDTNIVGTIDLKHNKELNEVEIKKLTTINQWRNLDIDNFLDILVRLSVFLGADSKFKINKG